MQLPGSHPPPEAEPSHPLMFAQRSMELQGAATVALGQVLAPHALWSTGAIPAIRNGSELFQHLVQARCPLWRAALHNSTENSPLDDPDPVIAHLSRHTPATIAVMSQAFTDHFIISELSR